MIYNNILNNKTLISDLYKLNEFTIKKILNFLTVDNLNILYDIFIWLFENYYDKKNPNYNKILNGFIKTNDNILKIKTIKKLINNDDLFNNKELIILLKIILKNTYLDDLFNKQIDKEILDKINNIDNYIINKYIESIKVYFYDIELTNLKKEDILFLKTILINFIKEIDFVNIINRCYLDKIALFLIENKIIIDNFLKNNLDNLLDLNKNLYYLFIISERYFDLKLEM